MPSSKSSNTKGHSSRPDVVEPPSVVPPLLEAAVSVVVDDPSLVTPLGPDESSAVAADPDEGVVVASTPVDPAVVEDVLAVDASVCAVASPPSGGSTKHPLSNVNANDTGQGNFTRGNLRKFALARWAAPRAAATGGLSPHDACASTAPEGGLERLSEMKWENAGMEEYGRGA